MAPSNLLKIQTHYNSFKKTINNNNNNDDSTCVKNVVPYLLDK